MLARKVRLGDPDNVEAAARRYRPLLLGSGFRRGRGGRGVNALLNCGYAGLRAGVARAVMAAGLHPSLGLKHENRSNSIVLVDDLMEPFRPAVDLEVRRLIDAGVKEIDRDAKVALARIMIVDMPAPAGISSVMACAARAARSLARAYAVKSGALDLPLSRLPLER